MGVKASSRSVRKASPALAVALALTFAVGSVDAAFGEALAEAPAIDVISEIAPDLLRETSNRSSVVIGKQGGAGQSASVSIPDTKGASGISFSIDYATASEGKNSGITVLATETPSVKAYVQPTTTGVRVLTAIEAPNAPTEYSYTFDVPEGTKLVPSTGGFLLESGAKVLGSIRDAWALDANGRMVPTSYEWDGRTLTQVVDLSSPSILYPVLADPAWGYTYSYATSKTPAENAHLLKACFNCFFPVDGAPAEYPDVDEVLPLTVAWFNFECTFAGESTGSNYFGFQFDATANHVDEYGSSIIFEFRVVGGHNQLIVDAYIVNDAVWLNNPGVQLGAFANWAAFRSNLDDGIDIPGLSSHQLIAVHDTSLDFDGGPCRDFSSTIHLGGQVDATIYWGDGSSDHISSSNHDQETGADHTYSAGDGPHLIAIDGTFTKLGGNWPCLRKVNSWHGTLTTNASYGFASAPHLTAVKEIPTTVTNMSSMLEDTRSFDGDVSGWDTTGVTNMSHLFLRSSAAKGLSQLDVSSVTNMDGMFFFAKVNTPNLSGWDTSNVTSMDRLFSEAKTFNGNVSGWDTSAVTNMRDMFKDAHSFNQYIGDWDVAAVVDMREMFNRALAFNQDIGQWNTASVVDMGYMFNAAIVFDQDIGDWDVANVADMQAMFQSAESFDQDLSGWNVSNVTQRGQFASFSALSSAHLPLW